MARSPRGVRASFVGAPTRSAIRLSCNGQCNVGHATLATSSAPRLGALGAAAHASRMRRRRQKRRQAWLICGNISAIVPFRRHASPAAPNHGRTAGQAGKLREVRRVRSLGGYGRSQRCEGARAPLRRNARAAAALAHGRSALEDSIGRPGLRLGPDAKNVTVRIFDLELVGPVEILRRAFGCARRLPKNSANNTSASSTPIQTQMPGWPCSPSHNMVDLPSPTPRSSGPHPNPMRNPASGDNSVASLRDLRPAGSASRFRSRPWCTKSRLAPVGRRRRTERGARHRPKTNGVRATREAAPARSAKACASGSWRRRRRC